MISLNIYKRYKQHMLSSGYDGDNALPMSVIVISIEFYVTCNLRPMHSSGQAIQIP